MVVSLYGTSTLHSPVSQLKTSTVYGSVALRLPARMALYALSPYTSYILHGPALLRLCALMAPCPDGSGFQSNLAQEVRVPVGKCLAVLLIWCVFNVYRLFEMFEGVLVVFELDCFLAMFSCKPFV